MIPTTFLRSAATSALAALAFISSVHAAAPMVKTSAPGYYRVMLGEFEITAINDGTLPLPMDKILTGIKPADYAAAIKKRHLNSAIETSFNAFLINTGAKLVLVDTGAGKNMGPCCGKLLANIKASGYLPEQIDEIYITHMHGDHIGGLTTDGVANFPNAIVRADKLEADYFLSQANLDKAKADDKGNFSGPIAAFQPYLAAGHFHTFEGNTDLVPGVQALAAHGHTPGHTIYLVDSKGQKLILWGDLMHVASVQFDRPKVAIQFDSDSKAAITEREKAYATAAKEGYLIGSAHLSFPGLGYLHAEGKGYGWTPVNYVSLP